MGLSVRRVSVLATALALLMSAAVAVQMTIRADAATCVFSRTESYGAIGAGVGFGRFTWPGGNAKATVTYRTPSSTKNIRIRLEQGGNSTSTILQGNAGRQVTKTVSVGYQPRSKTMLWFEPAGDSPKSSRVIYSVCLYKA